MEDALHLAGVLRFIAIFFVTVGIPSILLAYFGVASIRTEEQSVADDISRDATALADAFWTQTDRRFTGFEERVFTRLEAGRTPLESPGELHPHLLVALRFDESGRLLAPFVEEEGSGAARRSTFDRRWQRAWELERGGAPLDDVLAAYDEAAAQAATRQMEGRARFDGARVRALAGDVQQAEEALVEVEARFGGVRDAWGIRLRDLARLQQAQLLRQRDPGASVAVLRDLVEDLLASKWVVGEGGEAAVARRALSLLDPLAEREWASVARGRVAERSAMLYWTGEVLPELRRRQGPKTALRIGPGDLQWRAGDRAIWATTWWQDELYAFALDREAVLSELKADARGLALPDAPVVAYVAAPLDAPPTSTPPFSGASRPG